MRCTLNKDTKRPMTKCELCHKWCSTAKLEKHFAESCTKVKKIFGGEQFERRLYCVDKACPLSFYSKEKRLLHLKDLEAGVPCPKKLKSGKIVSYWCSLCEREVKNWTEHIKVRCCRNLVFSGLLFTNSVVQRTNRHKRARQSCDS